VCAQISPPAHVYDGLNQDFDITTNWQHFTVSWDRVAASNHTVTNYRILFGITNGDMRITNIITPSAATNYTFTNLMRTPAFIRSNTYYITVRARVYKSTNRSFIFAGSNAYSDGIMFIDTNIPTPPTQVIDGLHTDTDVRGSILSSVAWETAWTPATDTHSGIAEYEIAITTNTNIAFSNALRITTTQQTQTTVLVPVASFINGTRYYTAVRARDYITNYAPPAFSDGIVWSSATDFTPPPQPDVVIDGIGSDRDIWTQSNQWSLSWNSVVDNESGIDHYDIAIGVNGTNTNLLIWTNVGTATNAVITGVNLMVSNFYYSLVRAVNGYGLTGQYTVSDGAYTFDFTPPIGLNTIIDGPVSNISVYPYTNHIYVSWSAAHDAQSGGVGYYLSLGTSAASPNNIIYRSNVGSATNIILTNKLGIYSNAYGTILYFNVIATNAAGLYSEITADGVRIVHPDVTPPLLPDAVYDGMDAGIDVDSVTWDTAAFCTWTPAYDPDSSITGYRVSLGTFPGGSDIAGPQHIGIANTASFSNLNLAYDTITYYFTVTAYNAANLQSTNRSSDGFRLLINRNTTNTLMILNNYLQPGEENPVVILLPHTVQKYDIEVMTLGGDSIERIDAGTRASLQKQIIWRVPPDYPNGVYVLKIILDGRTELRRIYVFR